MANGQPTEAQGGLIGLIGLLHRVRDAASAEEVGFIAVNETAGLVRYRQAVLWEKGRGVVAVSGVPSPEANAPFTQWLQRVCRQVSQSGPVDRDRLSPADRDEWREWLPPFAYWLAMPRTGAALLLARDEEWNEGETAILTELVHAYDHGLFALRRPTLWSLWKTRIGKSRRKLAGLAVAVVLIAAFPVHLTVLAPAEVVSRDPAVIRAPMEGVVAKIMVHPSQRVEEGQILFELDDTTLKGKAEVAEKSLAAAEAELRQISQQAVFDPTAKPKLATIAGRREQQQAELDYLHTLLERIRVKAPAKGTAVLDDSSEWVGKPVSVGEKVMALADERDTEIEAWLASADMVDLQPGTDVTVFLNVSPLSPVTAKLIYVAYEATVRPDASVAYRVRAAIPGNDKPRLGLRGTARLSGERVPLIYWLLRRPIGSVRGWLGL